MIVETAAGRIEGTAVGAGGQPPVLRFLGVPYAAPPVGPRRWAPPAPPEPWTGVRPATEHGAIAPQTSDMLDQVIGLAERRRDEDCLSLGVWTPACDGARRAVLVWVHGGAFVSGAGSATWFDGERLARSHDVVVVTINYRLGALGFLHLADLVPAAGRDRWDGAGNAGLLDVVAALDWVRAHAASFGGDPGRVTVFGESAGGAMTAALLASPPARGRFAGAVLQSPSLSQFRSRDEASAMAERFLHHAGLDATRADELRALPAERLVAAQQAMWRALGRGAFTAYAPTPGDAVLPVPVTEAVRSGAAGGVPVVVGTTLDEMQLFTTLDPSFATMTRDGLLARAGELLGSRAEATVEAYERILPGAAPGTVASAIATDSGFLAPAVALADDLHAAGSPVHRYLFTWRSTAFGGVLGACHGLELPFVFDTLDAPGVAFFTGEGPDRADLAREMSGRWAAFAREGRPDLPGSPWPRHDPATAPAMVFDTPSRVEADPHGARRRWWADARHG